jgi:NTE family protein
MTRAALVLSGGGLLGVGWELGVLRGLQDGAIDMGAFAKVIGTSAGAMAGAIAASGAPLEAIAPDLERDNQFAAIVQQVNPETMGPLFAALMAGGEPDQARRAHLGALALQTQVPEDLVIDVIDRYMPAVPWPRSLIVTAVDVADGAFVSWGIAAGVELVRAAAASSAVPGILPPITVAGHRYMDGAMRSPTSADLAAGSDLVVIVAAPSRSEQSDRQIAAETADIRAAGGEIIEIRPDAQSGEAFGPDAMDGSRQPLVFEAGLRQGLAASSEVAARIG